MYTSVFMQRLHFAGVAPALNACCTSVSLCKARETTRRPAARAPSPIGTTHKLFHTIIHAHITPPHCTTHSSGRLPWRKLARAWPTAAAPRLGCGGRPSNAAPRPPLRPALAQAQARPSAAPAEAWPLIEATLIDEPSLSNAAFLFFFLRFFGLSGRSASRVRCAACRTWSLVSRTLRTARCRKPPKRVVKRPARPYQSAIHNRCSTVNAKER